jgi:hypothetical protein
LYLRFFAKIADKNTKFLMLSPTEHLLHCLLCHAQAALSLRDLSALDYMLKQRSGVVFHANRHVNAHLL